MTYEAVQAAAHVFAGKEPHVFGRGSGVNDVRYQRAYQHIQRLMNVPPTASTVIVLAALTNCVIELTGSQHNYSSD